jgi:long-chain acyl-CoA synthetase
MPGPLSQPPISQPQVLDDVTTLPELLRWRVRTTPAAEAYRHFDAVARCWVAQSWHEIDAEFELWRRALAAEGFAPGERVAILMPNGIPHVAMDQAALSRSLVPVPMHAVDNPDSIAYILVDSGSLLLFVDSHAGASSVRM